MPPEATPATAPTAPAAAPPPAPAAGTGVTPPTAPTPPTVPATVVPTPAQAAAHIARVEKQLRDEKAARKTESARLAALEAEAAEWKDPVSAFVKRKGDYKKLTNLVLADDEPVLTDEQKAIAELRTKLEERDAKDAETAKQAADRAAAEKRSGAERYAADFIGKNAEKYPLIHGLDGSNMLLVKYQEMIDAGEEPTDESVADAVEAHIERALDAQLAKVANHPKFKALLVKHLKQAQAPKAKEGKDDGGGTDVDTITQTLGTQATGEVDYKSLTEQERSKRAKAAFRAA